jgi:hypothetical protein
VIVSRDGELRVAHTGVCWKSGDTPPPGSPLWSMARVLLGTLKSRLALGGVAVCVPPARAAGAVLCE